MKMIIDELVTLLGLDIDKNALQKIQAFEKMLDGVTKTVGYVSAGLLSAASGIGYFAERANQTSANLKKLGDITGLNTTAVQEMGIANQIAGGSYEDMTSAMVHLQEISMNPMLGIINTQMMQMGVTADTAEGKVVQLARAFEDRHFDKKTMMQWANSLGVTGILPLINQGEAFAKAQIEASKKMALIVSPERLAMAQKFTIQLGLMRKTIDMIGQNVSASAGPAMEKLLGKFQDWMIVNKRFIELGLNYVVDGIVTGFNAFGEKIGWVKDKLVAFKDYVKELFPEFDSLADKFKNVNGVATIVEGALMSLGLVLTGTLLKAAAANPIITILSGLIFLITDFLNYVQGKPSAIKALSEAINEFFSQFEKNHPKMYETIKVLESLLQKIDEAHEKQRSIDLTQADTDQKEKLYNFKKDHPFLANAIELFGDIKNKPGSGDPYSKAYMAQPSQLMSSHNSNSVVINQNISGDGALGMAWEVKRSTLDALTQTYPGLFTQVVN